MKEQKAIEYLRALTLKITGIASEKASIQDYIDEIVYYFTNILHSMPNNVYWLDRNCVLRGGNDELAHKLNLKSGFDLEGLTYEQMAQAAQLPIKEFEPYRITELEVMKTGTPSVAKEEPPITDHGKTFFYLSNKTPLRNRAGQIIGVVGISTDITKLKKTQLDLAIALKNPEAAQPMDKKDNCVGVISSYVDLTGYLLIPKGGKYDFKNQRFYLGKTFGNEYLTSRELEVFRYILYGYALKKIAILLNISLLTARWYVNSLRIKLQCRSKAEIMSVAIKHGLTYVLEEYKVWKNLKND